MKKTEVIAGTIVVCGPEIRERYSVPGLHLVIPSTEAIVGRLLMHVSVAGVGWRTVRRCAVGVYNC
jgi:hypothetical protein